MEAKKLCCGVDVSHTTLDVCYQNNLGELFHLHVGNNNKGFEKILEHTGTHYHFVMEATGMYYIRLAFFLHSRCCTQSVVNALSVKRYIYMHLERNKSDRKDATWICRYAIEQKPEVWQMPDGAYFQGLGSFTILFVSIQNNLNGLTISCTAFVCFLWKVKTQSNH